jgi:hypothetical protein
VDGAAPQVDTPTFERELEAASAGRAPWTDRRDRHGVCAQQPGCSTARA